MTSTESRQATASGAALFMHLLDRYANDAPNKTELDQAIAAKLNTDPSTKEGLKALLSNWHEVPVEKKIARFGPQFARLQHTDAVDLQVVERELKATLARRLPEIAPGFRGNLPIKALRADTSAPPLPTMFASNVAGAAAPVIPRSNVAATLHTMGTTQPTYRIDFAGIYCQKEASSDWDLSNEDEPYVIISVYKPYEEPWTRRTLIYEGANINGEEIDSGDDWGPLPTPLAIFGKSGPEVAQEIGILAVMMEHDKGDPNAYRDKINLLVKAGQAVAAAKGYSVPDAVANLVTEAINSLLGTADDNLGAGTFVLQPNAFAYYAQQPLTHFKVQLDYHFPIYHTNGDAKYFSFYRIVRNGSAPIPPESPTTKSVRYSCLWNASTKAQVWWPNCSEEQLRAKTGELWGSMRLEYMQPFVVDGQVRYNCLWTPGTFGQVWWPNCSEQDFRNKTGETWSWARPAQAYAFVVNGQIRYSCLWNAGTQGQVWWPNCSEQDFRNKTGETWSWARIAQVQPFVVNGQIRYSCLLNAGTCAQTWLPNCSEQDFRNKTGETWSSQRPAQVYGFVVDGQIRYSCLWNAGTYAQVWWPNCSEQDFRNETGEDWSWGRPAQVQAFVI